ncbi:uncharacterized protein LOC115888774 isoform X3 [Sitophilus oryzae]|uniref:Uncharacterized protein LOC115888774 isoform X3 n=1 Tax=Sitophilus oryzae TaxID=7048 RepID=A0A6J2YMG3_SITOR|nr:uncharacterized protein LOC115888774 isoform X3 [Sitophilus oryzae]
MELPLINNCESFVLTAPFRVKSTQLEIKTLTGSVEQFVRQIRQNVLQIPVRPKLETSEDVKFEPSTKKITKYRTKMSSRVKRRSTDESVVKDAEFSFNDRSERRFSDPEKKVGRHTDKNFIQKNIQHAATVRKIEYDTDEDENPSDKRRRSSQSSNKPRRRSSDSPPASIADRPDLQPVKLSEDVVAILEDMAKEGEDKTEKPKLVEEKVSENKPEEKARRSADESGFGGRIVVQDHMRIHLKQTTCPACMEKYRIPLPTPKTPRVKPSSVIPLAPGENPDLKTNSQHRLSMLINKEMFKLQSYERRFSSDENSSAHNIRPYCAFQEEQLKEARAGILLLGIFEPVAAGIS